MKCSDNMEVTLESFNAFLSSLEEELHTLLAMGDAYRWGNEEVEPDATMAMEFYREAAELGDWEAMELLADMLEEQGNSRESEAWYGRINKEKLNEKIKS